MPESILKARPDMFESLLMRSWRRRRTMLRKLTAKNVSLGLGPRSEQARRLHWRVKPGQLAFLPLIDCLYAFV